MKYLTCLVLLLFSISFSCRGKRSGNLKAAIVNINDSIGKVIAVIDGDTFDILLEGNKKVRVRMDAIDAPEKGMPYYKVAKNYLSEMCFQKEVKLVFVSADIHGRSVNRSFLMDGTDLSKEMIRQGLAWHYKQYSSDVELANLENEAKNKRIGLWADKKTMPPWEVRKYRRAGNHVAFLGDTIMIVPTHE